MTLLEIIAEPRRQELLRLVWSGERSAGDLAKTGNVTFGAVSQHLKILRDAGLVRVRKEGRRRFYRADRERLGSLGVVLEEMWRSRLHELKAAAEAEQRKIDLSSSKATRD